jgi:hypothetical protein
MNAERKTGPSVNGQHSAFGVALLVCCCGRWMHTDGVEELGERAGEPPWLVRYECCGCGLRVGAEAFPAEGRLLVDRLMWTDEAYHALDRLPPYVRPLVRREVEHYARSQGEHVVTFELQLQARQGGRVAWDAEAERRLNNVPAPVRVMARLELERMAIESGHARVTVGLMEQVKARYFGIGPN